PDGRTTTTWGLLNGFTGKSWVVHIAGHRSCLTRYRPPARFPGLPGTMRLEQPPGPSAMRTIGATGEYPWEQISSTRMAACSGGSSTRAHTRRRLILEPHRVGGPYFIVRQTLVPVRTKCSGASKGKRKPLRRAACGYLPGFAISGDHAPRETRCESLHGALRDTHGAKRTPVPSSPDPVVVAPSICQFNCRNRPYRCLFQFRRSAIC